MVKWLLFLDLDGTLWDHLDVSMLKPPFFKVKPDLVRDSEGVLIRLHYDIVKLLEWAKDDGALVSTLSWNKPSHALGVLEAFSLIKLFDYHGIEPHPAKEEYALKVVKTIEKEHGIKLKPCQIVYIDDRRIHVEGMVRKLGPIIFLQAWTDFRSFNEAKNKITKKLCKKDQL